MNVTMVEIAQCAGASIGTVHGWTGKKDWPEPVVEKSTGGRPLKKWNIQALPVVVTVGGKEVKLRKALVDHFFAKNVGAALENAPVAISPQTAAAAPAPVLPQQRAAAPATDRQRQIAEARAAILVAIDNIKLALAVSQQKAILEIIARAKADTLPAHLKAMIATANARAGESGKRTLSERTIKNWIGEAKNATTTNGAVNLLMPKVPQPAPLPEWAAAFRAEHANGQNRTIADAVRAIAGNVGIAPHKLYARARRLKLKFGTVDWEKGRAGQHAMMSLLPYRERKTDSLVFGVAVISDGKKFDAKIADRNGQPTRPEVVVVEDIATRFCVGFSVGDDESALLTVDAVRHACRWTIPALFHSDNGPGFVNELLSGLFTRLGITPSNSIPRRSQSNGLIERLHQTLLNRLAQKMTTYIGPKVDDDYKKKVHKLVMADLKAASKKVPLPTLLEFVADVEAAVEEYNNTPHSALPQIWDEAQQLRRRMTPCEMKDKHIAEGAELFPLSAEDGRELFLPQVETTVRRGRVSVNKQKYFSYELAQWNGNLVRCGYDIHDGSVVMVYNTQGQFICEAKFGEGIGSDDFFPKSKVEQAEETRLNAQLKRLEKKADRLRANLPGNGKAEAVAVAPVERVINAVPLSVVPALSEPEAVTNPEAVRPEAVIAPETVTAPGAVKPARPLFLAESDRYRWLMRNRNDWTERDLPWLLGYVGSDEYADLKEFFESDGLAWGGNELMAAVG